MASEQPELLFFDTFSHETSEQRLHENSGAAVQYSLNLEGNGTCVPDELELIDELKKEETETLKCGFVFSEQNKGLLSSPKQKTPSFGDEQNKDNLSLEDIVTLKRESYELQIDNVNQTSETFKFIHDLWIPSLDPKIQDAYFPMRDFLTCPVIYENELTCKLDKVAEKINEVGGANFIASQIQEVSQDEQGLLELVQKEYFTSAVKLTARLLLELKKADDPICHSHQSIQLWFTRLALMVKMQEFKVADREAFHWGDCDKPDLYYQFYPDIYHGRIGSMVPFQMRLLLANLPSYCDRYSESLEKLFSILATIKKILLYLDKEVASQSLSLVDFTNGKNFWVARKKHVLISIVNVAVKMKDFILAVDVINEMISNECNILEKQILYSILGRIHLQFGDVTSAEKLFLTARFVGKTYSNSQQNFQNIVDSGLLAIAQNEFHEAYQFFEEASYIDPTSLMLMNNCAVSLFYLGHLREGIRLLTGAVNNDPLHGLHDSLILNLCTMYELNSTRCRDNKIELLKFTTLFKGDSINISSFRLC